MEQNQQTPAEQQQQQPVSSANNEPEAMIINDAPTESPSESSQIPTVEEAAPTTSAPTTNDAASSSTTATPTTSPGSTPNQQRRTPLLTLHVTYVLDAPPQANSQNTNESSAEANNDSAQPQPQPPHQQIEVVFVLSPFGREGNNEQSENLNDIQNLWQRIPPEMLLRLLFGAGGRGSMSEGSGGFDDFLNRAFLQYQQAVRPAPPAKAALAALSEYVVAADAMVENCTICQEDFATGDKATKLPCTHSYHTDCVMQWLKEHHTCPICRHALPTEEAVAN